MKSAWRALLILSFNLTGCSYLGYACHNLVTEPADCIHDCMFECRLRRLARAAWRESCAGNPRHADRSRWFVQGFEDGFVDYVDRNGQAEPPAMPPSHLRHCRDPLERQRAIEDWYAGFSEGAEAARQSSLRDRVITPIGMPPRSPYEPAGPPTSALQTDHSSIAKTQRSLVHEAAKQFAPATESSKVATSSLAGPLPHAEPVLAEPALESREPQLRSALANKSDRLAQDAGPVLIATIPSPAPMPTVTGSVQPREVGAPTLLAPQLPSKQ
jgi:hypothetical protein